MSQKWKEFLGETKSIFPSLKKLDSRLNKQNFKNMSDIKPLKMLIFNIQKIFKVVPFFQLKSLHTKKIHKFHMKTTKLESLFNRASFK